MIIVTHLWQSTLCVGAAALLCATLRHSSARTRQRIWLCASAKFLVPFAAIAAAGRLAALWAPVLTAPGQSSALGWLDRPLAVWNTRRSSRPRRIELLQCPSPCEPGVYGVIRPRLLWPIGLSDRLGDAELQAVLAHEAVHVDRHDNLAAAVQMVVETIFWFFPPVWWLGGRLLDDRERACDEEVLRMGTDERRYAAGIVQVCGFCLRAPAAFVAGVGGSSLNDRIERILRRATPDAPARSIRLLLAAALVMAIAAPFGTGVLSASRASAGGQDRGTVYQAGEGITLPKVVKEVKPVYTPGALKARIQGSVGLEAIVLETGAVGEVTVVRSLDTQHGLDDEAVKALKQWQFEPGTKDGKAVRVRLEVEMTFKLG